jgi:hypothetical protein
MEWRQEMEWNGDNMIPLETASLATAHRVIGMGRHYTANSRRGGVSNTTMDRYHHTK